MFFYKRWVPAYSLGNPLVNLPYPISDVSRRDQNRQGYHSKYWLESREYSRRDPSRWQRGTLYPQKLALTSPTSGGCLVSLVRLRTQAMEFNIWLTKARPHLNKPHMKGQPRATQRYLWTQLLHVFRAWSSSCGLLQIFSISITNSFKWNSISTKFFFHRTTSPATRTYSIATAKQNEKNEFFFCNPILFAICTSTFSKLCKNIYSGK
jgi:hypothetical protein